MFGLTQFIKTTGALLLVVISAACLGYQIHQRYVRLHPCESTIHYRLGTIDPRFGVSRDDFINDIAQAANIWSTATHKMLFTYDPQGSLVINLIYDTRQQTTQQESALKSDIAQTNNMAAGVKGQYTALLASHTAAQQAYATQLAQFKQEQESYMHTVDYWNSRGGAPTKEYEALSAQKAALTSEQQSLEAQRQQVNNLASQINALIDKYNLLVNHINANVTTINTDGLAGTEFEEGVYISDKDGTRINIYQFDNQTFFIRVLAHELGHALGLEHNQNPDSIMNPLNQSESLALSPDDVAALNAICNAQ